MKLAMATLSLVVSLLALLINVRGVTSLRDEDFVPFVTFNHGETTSSAFCTTAEVAFVQQEVTKATIGERRRLGSSHSKRHRQMPLVSCTQPLTYYAGAKCAILPRRRLLNSGDDTAEGTRALAGPNVCDDHIAKFNAVLDSLQPKLSEACRQFTSVRSFDCLEMLSCDITGIDYWNADKDKVERTSIDQDPGMREICAKDRVNFEAKTNFDVGDVKFTLTSDNGYSFASQDYQGPYFLYPHDHADVVSGQTLLPGLYTFTSVAAKEPTKVKTFQFRVKSC